MQERKQQNDIFAYLILIILILAVILLLSTIALLITKAVVNNRTPDATPEQTEQPQKDLDTSLPTHAVELENTPDAGMDYIDQMVFFGESTTTHLKARGVLRDGNQTKQVWADESGTKTLSSRLLSETLIYPKTGESLTVAQAVSAEKPTYLVLSFGLNNISGFIKNKSLYVNNYKKMIDTVLENSPETRIILQSVYPVSSNCISFSVDGATVCSYTKILNGWLQEIAAEYENVRYVNTASVLYDETGMLAPAYDQGDGVHLTTAAYQQILYYLRTHAWQDEHSS